MNKTLHSESDAEVKQKLDTHYQAMRVQFEQNGNVKFGNNMHNKLVYYTYHFLKNKNYNIDAIKKIEELSEEYMHSLISKSNSIENNAENISNDIGRDRQIIEEFTEELFYDSSMKLNDNQYSALRPVLHNYILQKSFSMQFSDKEKEIAHIFKQLDKNSEFAEHNFNDIYDFLSDEETFESLKFKAALANAKDIQNNDLFEKQEKVDDINHTLLNITQEVTDISDIAEICSYIVKSKELKPIETKYQKEATIKTIITKWALNMTKDQTRQGSSKTKKFIFELENLFDEESGANIKLTDDVKKIGTEYAKELNDLSEALKKHFNIKINDSGIRFKDLKTSKNDTDLFNFTNNLRENLKMEANAIKIKAEYVDTDNLFIEMHSLLGKKNKIGTTIEDVNIIQNAIKNTSDIDDIQIELKKEKMISILRNEHSHITETRLYDMDREKLIKKRHSNSDLNKLDYHFTKGRVLPLFTNEKTIATPAAKFLDMKDDLTSKIYFNFTKTANKFHNSFGTKNPQFYKNAMNYLFEKRKSALKSILLFKTEKRIIELHENGDQNNLLLEHEKINRQSTR